MTYYIIVTENDFYDTWISTNYTDGCGNVMLFTRKEAAAAKIEEIISRNHKNIEIEKDFHDPENGIWHFFDTDASIDYKYSIEPAVVFC